MFVRQLARGFLTPLLLVIASSGAAAQSKAGSSALDGEGRVGTAQPGELSGSSERAARLAQARNHFLLGMQLFDAHDYRDALREFRLVEPIAPSAELWFNMACAHQELGEYDRAARAFERYLRDQVDAKDAGAVRARIAELNRLAAQQRSSGASLVQGSLRIHTRDAAALVLLDGRKLEPAALAEPLLVAAGRHRLDASAPRRIPLHATVEIAPGLLTAAYVELPPMRVASPVPAEHGTSWVLFGLAGAGLATSIVFAALAVDRQAEANIGAARAWAVRTDVALLGTGVCALAAAVVYLVEARGARTQLSPERASR